MQHHKCQPERLNDLIVAVSFIVLLKNKSQESDTKE